jgi:hypothetical protein
MLFTAVTLVLRRVFWNSVSICRMNEQTMLFHDKAPTTAFSHILGVQLFCMPLLNLSCLIFPTSLKFEDHHLCVLMKKFVLQDFSGS